MHRNDLFQTFYFYTVTCIMQLLLTNSYLSSVYQVDRVRTRCVYILVIVIILIDACIRHISVIKDVSG